MCESDAISIRNMAGGRAVVGAGVRRVDKVILTRALKACDKL